MKQATLCFLRDEEKILLGMKKRGFGEGKWNGFGGKPEEGETLEEAAVRELKEEAGIDTSIESLEKFGKLDFKFPHEDGWDMIVHIFLVNEWNGEARETEEMKPEWYHIDEIPYDKMWSDDIHWLPLFLENKKFEGKFVFDKDNESIADMDLRELNNYF